MGAAVATCGPWSILMHVKPVLTVTGARAHVMKRTKLGEVVLYRLRACLHGVGDPGLVGLVSFVFTLWGTQNKRNLPHQTGVPQSM